MLGVESLDRQTGGVGGEWCSLKLHHYKFFRDVWQFIGGCLVAIILAKGAAYCYAFYCWAVCAKSFFMMLSSTRVPLMRSAEGLPRPRTYMR
jgi:hypothetical protein